MDSERAVTRDDRAYGLSFADALNDCLDAAVIIVSHDRHITAFNKQAEKLTRLSAAAVLNSPFKSLPPPLRRVIEQSLESGQAVENSEIALDHGSLRVSTFVSMQKGKGSVILALHDMAPVQKLERNMRQLDRLASVGALSASMAHEIKNAMVAIRTFVDVLVKENKGGELAPIVSREMRRIDSIVSQMLRLAGPAKPTLASIHLHSVLDHALHLVEHQVHAKKLKTRHEFAAPADLLHGDEYQLQQAFLNLFFNAIEAMEPGGELTVKTEKLTKPRSIRVTVADTGVGIPPGDLSRLFDAFFTTKKQGTGLGLAITRRIVQEHKGTITVESEPKKGTAFHVTLPT